MKAIIRSLCVWLITTITGAVLFSLLGDNTALREGGTAFSIFIMYAITSAIWSLVPVIFFHFAAAYLSSIRIKEWEKKLYLSMIPPVCFYIFFSMRVCFIAFSDTNIDYYYSLPLPTIALSAPFIICIWVINNTQQEG